jgi:hypothetical protein
VDKTAITYTPRPDATPETEISALGNVYRFILDCHAKQNAAGVTSTNGDDAKKGSKNVSRHGEYTR